MNLYILVGNQHQFCLLECQFFFSTSDLLKYLLVYFNCERLCSQLNLNLNQSIKVFIMYGGANIFF